MSPSDETYRRRGSAKLAAALDHAGLDVRGLICADLGSHVGGFVDVLLRRGATRVYAVEKGYGVLDYVLRRDARVVVLERHNAMHVTLPEPCDLVTIDVAWTRQHNILPAAIRLLKPTGRIITLVKPHYEADRAALRDGVLPDERVEPVVRQAIATAEALGLTLLDRCDSPIRGHAGNREVILMLVRSARQNRPVRFDHSH